MALADGVSELLGECGGVTDGVALQLGVPLWEHGCRGSSRDPAGLHDSDDGEEDEASAAAPAPSAKHRLFLHGASARSTPP